VARCFEPHGHVAQVITAKRLAPAPLVLAAGFFAVKRHHAEISR
jgi:hypothetical protein